MRKVKVNPPARQASKSVASQYGRLSFKATPAVDSSSSILLPLTRSSQSRKMNSFGIQVRRRNRAGMVVLANGD